MARLADDDRAAEIAAIMSARRMNDATLIKEMKLTRDRVNGDIVIPLPDVDTQGQGPFPNLMLQGIEQNALRGASVIPNLVADPLDWGSNPSRTRAERRRKGVKAMWDRSNLIESFLPRSFRHLVAYGTFAAVAVPDFKTGHAVFELRDTLGAYPSPRSDFDDMNPEDVGFVYGKPWNWIATNYPEAAARWLGGQPGLRNRVGAGDQSTLYDVVEWVDHDETVMCLLGARTLGARSSVEDGLFGTAPVVLRRWENRAEYCPAVVPRRITLDRLQGQMAGLIGMADLGNKLMLLDVIAAEKAVFGDIVVYGDDPELVTGAWKDGRTGQANIVRRGEVKYLVTSPGPLTHPVIDRIERTMRTDGGIPAQYGGEIPTGIRTGRASDTVLGAAVDARIQENQRIMARALRTLNAAGMAIERGWWGAEGKSWMVDWPGSKPRTDYIPNRDFETPHTQVDYALAGTDASALTVMVGQMLGLELITKTTARRMHPGVGNPDFEDQMHDVEVIRAAGLAAFGQAIAQRDSPIDYMDAALYAEKRLGGASPEEALREVEEAKRKRQAEQQAAQSPPEQAPPPAEAMPGLANGVQPAIGPPGESTVNFAALSRALAAPPRAAA